jgi:CBS domain-containing protein
MEKIISIQPTAQLWTALEKMGHDGVNQLPVRNGDGGNGIIGMLSRDDLVHYMGALQALSK